MGDDDTGGAKGVRDLPLGSRGDWQWMLVGAACALVSLWLTPQGNTLLAGTLLLPASCITHKLFHIACFGCGLTRSFVHTAHLHLATALAYHPVGPFLFLTLVAQLPYRALRLLRGAPALPPSRSTVIVAVFVLATAATWAARLAGWLPNPP